MIGYVKDISLCVDMETGDEIITLTCEDRYSGREFTVDTEEDTVRSLNLERGSLISIHSTVTPIINSDHNHVYPEGTIGT